MPTIPVSDTSSLTVDFDFDDQSGLTNFGLKSLKAQTTELLSAAETPLDKTTFEKAVLKPTFGSPSIQLSTGLDFVIGSEASLEVEVYRCNQANLFGSNGELLTIPISDRQAWVGISVKALFSFKAAASLPSGFGVSSEVAQIRASSSYLLVEAQNGQFPTLKQSIESAASQFEYFRNANKIYAQQPNTVQEWEVNGEFQVSGSYCFGLAANSFSLANVRLPFGQELQITPPIDVGLTGSFAVKGEFRGICYRDGGSGLKLGLYKKKESDLSVSFEAAAGVEAEVASTDLVSALFSALPGVDLKSVAVADADRKIMEKALGGAVNQGLSIAFNSCCTASIADEIAVLYEVDLAALNEDTRQALDAALNGNWTALSKLPNGRELRNVLTQTRERQGKTAINLLGILDYASVQDFARQCTIVHNPEDGSITLTDQETAKRISASETPFTADDTKLRKALDEAFLATIVYSAATAGAAFKCSISAAQSLSLYQQRISSESIRKNLRLGLALGLLRQDDLNQAAGQAQSCYYHLAAKATFEGNDAMRLFFSDLSMRAPYQETELQQLGRRVLASLLDPDLPSDQARLAVLQNDTLWEQVQAGKIPADSPASYSDWYDIATWAHAIAAVAPRLKTALEALEHQTGPDISRDANFMTARDALAKVIAKVTTGTNAAFEKGWPLAVTFALAGGKAPVSFEAQWNGRTHFKEESEHNFATA